MQSSIFEIADRTAGRACPRDRYHLARKEGLKADRYRLARYRPLIGALEVVGAIGLIAGFFYPRLIAPAAGGLSLMMAAGVGVRLSIGDSVVQMIPAVFFLAVNSFIFISANAMV